MTERLARACVARPWTVVAAWLAVLLAAAAALLVLLPGALTTEADVATATEASRGADLLEERFAHTQERLELVIVRSTSLTVDDDAFAEALAGAARELEAAPGISVPAATGERVVSGDRRATVLPFRLEEGRDVDAAAPVVARLDADARFDAALYGGAVIDRDFNAASQHDLKRGEAFGIAAALVVLVLVFGALVTALVPLLLALVAIVTTLGLVAVAAQVADLSIFVANIVAGMGLALGIDYTLFVVSRVREERGRGLALPAALGVAGATASRAVLFSGIAVALALMGILLVPDTVLRSLGIGAVLVAAVSVLVALTLLPALLALLGDRADALRVPLVGRVVEGGAEGRFWAWLARRVMRRPLVAALAAGGLLLLASTPVLGLTSGRLGVETLPERYEARRGYDLLRDAFGYGRLYPTRVVAAGDADELRPALERLGRRLAAEARYSEPRVETSPDGTAVLLEVAVAGDALSEEAFGAVRDLRARHLPAAGLPAVSAGPYVTGISAANLDYVRVTSDARPAVFAFVFGMSFVLLTLAFRSLVVPLKAIILNLLSVGAAYGLLVLVFQHGVGARLLGFSEVDAIEVWVPVFLFAILFGLSMDYHVFLLSRIRERYRETGDNAHAIAYGVGTTGRVITGAALIIIVVFAGFALGELVMFQQMGFGVGVALLLDATVIRVVLVPATMALLGERNWYLPRWLGWLPRVQIEPGGLTPAASRRRLT